MVSARISVAIVDASATARSKLSEVCNGDEGLQVIYCGDRLAEVRAMRTRPNVVLLDLNLFGRQVNLRSVKDLVESGCNVVAIAGTGVSALGKCFLDVGVLGYATREDEADSYLQAINLAHKGKSWLSPKLSGSFDDKPVSPKLSSQERVALSLYASGMKLETVAWRMGVTPSTVKEYLDRVRAKYSSVGRPAPTKIDLYYQAVQDGFIKP